MDQTGRERRLQVLESNYGRDWGWSVELQGRRIALLIDSRSEDMFWESYRIEPLTDDARQIAGTALAAGEPFPESGRVLVRGLYLRGEPPSLWERFLLWRRGRAGTRNRAGVPPG